MLKKLRPILSPGGYGKSRENKVEKRYVTKLGGSDVFPSVTLGPLWCYEADDLNLSLCACTRWKKPSTQRGRPFVFTERWACQATVISLSKYTSWIALSSSMPSAIGR